MKEDQYRKKAKVTHHKVFYYRLHAFLMDWYKNSGLPKCM